MQIGWMEMINFIFGTKIEQQVKKLLLLQLTIFLVLTRKTPSQI